jgi:glycosyltransferase involved in cell wall biosynthesis
LKISIIIPTFNRIEFLQKALDSVMMQTYQPLEVIVVDDGSTDDTQSILHAHYPNIKYHYQKNQGVSSARNSGLKIATGDWIALLDSDDQWLPEKLKKQMQALCDYPDLKICHTEEIWIRNEVRVNPMKKHAKKGGNIFRHCLALCVISPSSVIIHRSVFEDIGNFDESYPACEDYEMWLRMTAKYPVLFIKEPLIKKYGGHQDQLSQKYWGMDRFRIRALEKILRQNILSRENHHAAREMLVKKANIYLAGAKKRGKLLECAHYEHLINQFKIP